MRIVLSSNISVWTVFYFILKQIAGTELDFWVFGGIGIEWNSDSQPGERISPTK